MQNFKAIAHSCKDIFQFPVVMTSYIKLLMLAKKMTKNNKLGFKLLIMPVTTVVQNITSITLNFIVCRNQIPHKK